MIVFHVEANSLGELRLEVCRELSLLMPEEPVQSQRPNDTEPKRPVGRPRKVQPEPLPEIDPEPENFIHSTDPNLDEEPEPNGADPDPVALEKLKQETVAKLPDMFAAGKVNLMRAVLTKYGKGAKSFPEIEAKDFPEIAAALARGDGS
jgi:hypothetical protein